jgi:hypothetical protein
MNTNYINNHNEGINSRSSESADFSISAELVGRDLVPNKWGRKNIKILRPFRTVSAQFDAAIQATDKATQAVEALAARMESR